MRYDEMAEHMRNVGSAGSPLYVQEPNLLSASSKNAVGSHCAACESIASVEEKEIGRSNSANIYLAKLSEQAERYDEIAEHMRDVGNVGSPLPVEERNLL